VAFLFEILFCEALALALLVGYEEASDLLFVYTGSILEIKPYFVPV